MPQRSHDQDQLVSQGRYEMDYLMKLNSKLKKTSSVNLLHDIKYEGFKIRLIGEHCCLLECNNIEEF